MLSRSAEIGQQQKLARRVTRLADRTEKSVATPDNHRKGKAVDEVLQEVDLGFSPADAELPRLSYAGADLTVHFVDWSEQVREVKFCGVLGFRWQAFNNDAPRDDASYEVVNSKWLETQATLVDEPADQYKHYRICFNRHGALDVVSQII